MSKLKGFLILFAAVIVSGCVTAPEYKDYSTFISADPHSILIVPVVNHSQEVEAADLFLATLPVPLSEKGYYVFPTNMVKKMMEADGLGDPMLVHSADTTRLAELFGADSVLYIEILEWTNKYNVLSAGVQVHFLYTIKDGRDGKLLWQDEQNLYYDRTASSGNAIVDLIATTVIAAVDSVSSDYTYVANGANTAALYTVGRGIPAGPYAATYQLDQTEFPASGTGRLSDADTRAVSYAMDPNINMKKQQSEDADEEETDEAEVSSEEK